MTDTERTEIMTELFKHAKLSLNNRNYEDAVKLLDMHQRLSFGMSRPAGIDSGAALINVREPDNAATVPDHGGVGRGEG